MAAPSAAPAAPDYWDDACRHLVRRDRVMKKLIPKFGEARLQSRGDAFTTLARSIVGQQISVKAAQSVWDKFAALTSDPPTRIHPSAVLSLAIADMRAAGLSARKIEYLVDLAAHFESGAVHVPMWQQMDDEAIIEELVAIRGIGRWTAEMLLIFRLGRPDVLPVDDYGVRKGFAVAFKKRELPSRQDLEKRAVRWKPYRTVASWYLWRATELKTLGSSKS